VFGILFGGLAQENFRQYSDKGVFQSRENVIMTESELVQMFKELTNQ
jgi:hypothetical protein